MSRRTKKTGSVATYGARYGTSVRKRTKKILDSSRKKYECPRCSYKAVKRVSTGVWKCRHCDHKFAGGAYQPESDFMQSKKLLFKKINEKAEG